MIKEINNKIQNKDLMKENLDYNLKKIYLYLCDLTEIKNRKYYYNNLCKVDMKQEYKNPILYQIKEEDGYYEQIDSNNDESSVIYTGVLSNEKDNIKYGFLLNDNKQIIVYKDYDSEYIYGCFVFNTLDGNRIIVKDVKLQKGEYNYFYNIDNYIAKYVEGIMYVALELKNGIFFYSSKEGMFLLKDVEFDYFSEEKNKFYVKPISNYIDISFAKEYDISNIKKENLIYTIINYFDENQKLKCTHNNIPKIYFYFTTDSSEASYVITEYLSYGFELEKIQNLFDDDTSSNYRICLNERELNKLPFIYYICEKFMGEYGHSRWNNPAVYSISCRTIISYAIHDYVYHKYYKKSSEIADLSNDIIERIKDKYNFQTNVEVAQFIYDNYILDSDILLQNSNNLIKYAEEKYGIYMENYIKQIGTSKAYKDTYNEIKNYLKKDLIINTKWKNEYELYKHISKLYSDAIWQYRSTWLKKQTLDIFIPSLKIAFEYQGIQHYQPVELFDGETGYWERKQRDKIKKDLCKENNIRLVYWKYDEIISSLKIQEKIKSIINNDE